MRKFPVLTVLAAFVLLTISSCADRKDENTNYLEEMSFNAWMERYINNDDLRAVRQSNGMYVEFLADGNQNTDETSYDTVVWVRMNYTARDLQKNVFTTRNEDIALQQGSFTPYTNYIPDYFFVGKGNENASMIAGQYYAFQNMLEKPDGSKIKVSTGTKLRLYMPSYLAFGTTGYSDSQGYGGQYSLSGTKPVIEDIEIIEVVREPILREEALVEDHALSRWGVLPGDSLETKYIYLDREFRPELHKPMKDEYALGEDSTLTFYFVGKFLDGFIFDTNIDSVYWRFYGRRDKEGYFADNKSLKALDYSISGDKNNYISAFYQVFSNEDVRRGAWYRTVFTSSYGYGANGLSAASKEAIDNYNSYVNSGLGLSNSSNSNYYGGYYDSYYSSYDYYNYSTSSSSSGDKEIVTEIQPYTPLIFEIYIPTREEEKGDE